MDVAPAVCPGEGAASGWWSQARFTVRDVPSPSASDGQAALFTFAITELVRQHRQSFAPPWTVDSWAKLLIWLALNSGCSTDQASLEAFAAGLGPALSVRLRRVFFERELDDLNLRLLADPAEAQAIALPLDPLAGELDPTRVGVAVERVGLSLLLTPPEHWRHEEALIVLPWREEQPCN